MEDIYSIEKLYKTLIPAFKVKLRILKNFNYNYIKMEDIWNFLKDNKWINANNLSIAEMVNDIIHCENMTLDHYLKEKLDKEREYFNR